MNSNKMKLEDFLKQHRPTAPEAPAWEKQTIWKKIEAEGLAPATYRRSFRIPRWVTSISVAAVFTVIVIGAYRHHQREERINRILGHILQTELVEGPSQEVLF